MRGVWAIVILGFGCAGRSEIEGACLVDSAEEALARTCLPTTLEPEANPESSSYGQVNCVMVVSGVAGTPFCDCASPGFAPASYAQIELARQENQVLGLCAGDCCEETCSCLLLQLSGDELAACQWPNESESSPRGWCYVEPDAGWGDPTTVADCPTTQRRLIRIVPKSIISHRVAMLACID